MAMTGCTLAIDQGTTSTRAIVFDGELCPVGVAQEEFPQHFSQPGWVEHEAEDLWQSSVATARAAIAEAGIEPAALAAIGIANQRETTLLWERQSGRPVHRAIVWQDRRTAEMCARLRAEGAEALVRERTGLLLDPYFSATKIAWILNQVEGALAAAKRGELAFGTVDSYLIWRLTGGAVHRTDATNASRTMLYDIHRGEWSDDLLGIFGIPRAVLPEVWDSAADYGTTLPEILGAPVAIRGVAGDQQAATVGQACFEPGMLKSTYGTGCFLLLNTGDAPVRSDNRLLTTIAYQFAGNPTYALEGSIFVAGAAVQWLRDGLGVLESAEESSALAATADPAQSVYLVPAFVGLGAPYWDADCRGSIHGLTRATGRAEIARAALESVCFQTVDLLDAMRRDRGRDGTRVLRVDGGMAASDWMLQRLADFLGAAVDRPAIAETTSLGAAYLAGFGAGVCPGPESFAKAWRRERRFAPAMPADERSRLIAGWRDAVRRTRSEF